ncbi:hypothetical protein KIM372_08940 [Bombiscardovia nodaiensis]|uniref:Uncharacterized protein n=1 Tax=Bombiscardovia nodaiensis TaxID=2932181 RepID=A0ABN6SCN3_9BIFI|nr:hypothetical protein KIM372_08940 [Bombiscardovia nodaiensis]
MKARMNVDTSVAICLGLFCLASVFALITAFIPQVRFVSLLAYPLCWVVMFAALALVKTESSRKKRVLTSTGTCFAIALILAKLIRAFSGNITLALIPYAAFWLILFVLLGLTVGQQAA